MTRISFTVHQARGLFFDRQKVQRSVGRAERRVLSRFGAFVRQEARQSLRKRKGTSRPGSPPYSHPPHPVRRFVLFVFDPDRRSVVIGPARLSGKPDDALETIEYGGRTVVRDRQRRKRRVRYSARPFMGPAFTKEQRKLPDLWRNSVR